MSLTQLTYIVAVAQTRNFVKAAKSCFISQPTLSMQIQKLEEELGVILFDRSRKPVEPTLIGK
ncbi:MAG: LysR family transcriptional regulator, partial [Nitrospina sp.]|nr:LysR family transcriptional regulator [Nitrospina sp.]